MFVFLVSQQDPGSVVVNVPELLDAPARDPCEERIAVVQSGGDKGMDKFLCICDRIREGRSLEMFLRWDKEVLDVLYGHQN